MSDPSPPSARARAMLAAMLFAGTARAATLEIDLTGSATAVRLDGRRLLFTTTDSDVRRVVVEASGPHHLTVHPLFGSRELAAIDLDLPATGTVGVVWKDGRLREIAPAGPLTVPSHAVRIDRSGALYKVPIRVRSGGESFLAIADTGATDVALCEPRLLEAGAEPLEATTVTVPGAGRVEEVRLTSPRIEVFGRAVLRATTSRSATCDLTLVGIEVLRKFSIVIRDGHLWAWVGDPEPSGGGSLQRRDTGTYKVAALGSGGRVDFTLDTGAETTTVGDRDAVTLGVVDTGARKRIITGQGTYEARVGEVAELTVAGRVLRDLKVNVMPGIAPGDGLLGLNALEGFEVRVSPAGAWLLDPATSGLIVP